MFSYKPNFIPRNIILIGAGGTGGRLLPPLAQLVRSQIRRNNPLGWIMELPIYIYDADVVEEKNLLRQNFAPQDVGKPKALVLAQRYSAAYGIPILPVLQMFGPIEDTLNPSPGRMSPNVLNHVGRNVSVQSLLFNSIVICAVDSAEARRGILRQLFLANGLGRRGLSTGDFFFIDAGNEDDFGQIRFFTNTVLRDSGEQPTLTFPSMIPIEMEVDGIPMDLEYYHNLGSSVQEASCAELPQTLAINTVMATLMLGVLQNFLQMRPMNFDGQNYNLKGGMSTNRNTLMNWRPRALPTPLPKYYESWVPQTLSPYHGLPSMSNSTTDVFLRTYWKLISDSYREAGLILKEDGTLEPIPRKAPVRKKKVEAARSDSDDDISVPVAVAPAPLEAPLV